MDLSALAVSLPAGCKIRLALSPYNWPLIWPTAGPPALLSLLPGGSLALPLKHSSATYDWQPAASFHQPETGPLCPTVEIKPALPTSRTFTQAPKTGDQVLTVTEAGGLLRLSPRGIAFGEDTESTYTMSPRGGADGGCAASAVITRRYVRRSHLQPRNAGPDDASK